MYRLDNVTKTYKKGDETVKALDQVQLTVGDGEWLAVQGRTGCGKTTLLNVLGGLDRPSMGVVELAGRDLTQMPDSELTQVRAAEVGFVFQTFNLVPTQTSAENIEAALVPLKTPEAKRRRAVQEALATVGLEDRGRFFPAELSGGQQQRVAIARALVKQPRVLLADEPTGNLDSDTSDELMAVLDDLWRIHGLTLVLVTHDRDVAHLAQRIAVMERGQLSIREDVSHEEREQLSTRRQMTGQGRDPSIPLLPPDLGAC